MRRRKKETVDNEVILKVRTRFLSKKFKVQTSKKNADGEVVKGTGKRDFWALKDINFDMYQGESIAIVGLNGSGKSTLLNLIDSSMEPTAGDLSVNGRVSYVAIGAGLKGNLTGRENIHLKLYLMGMTKKQVKSLEQGIIDFSELDDFIDQPIKDYSSGMKTKLAFSIAIHQDPDILIIDEALSVGDSTFAEKSAKKMYEFRQQKKTIFLVSHNPSQVRKWSDKVLWLHYGEVKEFGPTEEIFPKYQTFIRWFNRLSRDQQESYKEERLKEQFGYTMEDLRTDIENNAETDQRGKVLEDFDESVKKDKPRAKMSFFTKFCILLLVVTLFFTGAVAVSNIGLAEALRHPDRIFMSKKRVKDIKKNVKSTPSSSKSESKSSESMPATQDYTVVMGDTLDIIAAKFNISPDKIVELNPNIDFSLIDVGDVIKIPGGAKETQESMTETPAEVTEESTAEDTVETPVVEESTAEPVAEQAVEPAVEEPVAEAGY